VIDMGAIPLSRLVAADHQWRQRLGPHRQLEYFVLQDPLSDTAPQRLELVTISVGLLVVLHQPCSPAGSHAPIFKSQALDFGAQCRGLCLVEHVAYAQHHLASPGSNKMAQILVMLLMKEVQLLRYSKRKRSIGTLEHEMITVGLSGRKGGVDVQAKDLATAGSFGRGKYSIA